MSEEHRIVPHRTSALKGNPLLETYLALKGDQDPLGPDLLTRFSSIEDYGDFMQSTRRSLTRFWTIKPWLQRRYAFAIPDNKALDLLARHSPLVEMGAGSGYWAALLQARGVDIIPFDNTPPRLHAHRHPYRIRQTYTDVKKGGPQKLRNFPDRTLLICWPPYDGHRSKMDIQSLRHWQGKTLIYIGEHRGGCTGTHAFHDKVRDDFDLIAEQDIPQWWGLHDQIFVFERKCTH